jgi:RNA polymerase sigma-70 factor (ECF subfamily)
VNAILPFFDAAAWIWWLVRAVADGPTDPSFPIDDEDAAWFARVGKGDETALQRLFDKWKLPLLSFFYRSLGSHADAEDLTLEVFTRLHRAAADYRPSAKFSTYLFHIAQNLARNEHRRRRRKPAQPVPAELFDQMESSGTGTAHRLSELEEVFQRAMERLPEKSRTALLLVVQQQMAYPEAATALGITENALRVLVHRARQLLKIEMEALS